MPTQRIIILFILCWCYFVLPAQNATKKEVVEQESLKLYYAEQWPELLHYGKAVIRSGVDYPFLRMRVGYAALMQGNYSESLKHYTHALHTDKKDATALYYTYLNQRYLENTLASRYYGSKMSASYKKMLKLKKYSISSAALLYSFKYPTLDIRHNAHYGSVSLLVNLGYRFSLQQVIGYFNQTISEPQFLYVTDNQNIVIKQKEYYAKLNFAASGAITFIGGYHYIKTPFNNYSYRNQLGFGGVKYVLPYVQIQGMIHLGTLSDTAYRQADLSITVYPKGNTDLYSISRAAYGNQFTLTQIAGIKLMKYTWIEGNVTLGKYKVLLDNEDLYLFNDIDTKTFKVGGTIYYLVAKKALVSINYIFENKQQYGGTVGTNFYQHSTTIGIQWNF